MSKYLGNKNTIEVHDLFKNSVNCQTNEIKYDPRKSFFPDTLDQAHRKGYDNCAYCIGSSKR
jgi:hypothetical protein